MVGTWILWLPYIGNVSSQLTNSYFQRGRSTTNQVSLLQGKCSILKHQPPIASSLLKVPSAAPGATPGLSSSTIPVSFGQYADPRVSWHPHKDNTYLRLSIVMGPPKWMIIMENTEHTINNWCFGVPLFQETPICVNLSRQLIGSSKNLTACDKYFYGNHEQRTVARFDAWCTLW